jgi:hypothetical protein
MKAAGKLYIALNLFSYILMFKHVVVMLTEALIPTPATSLLVNICGEIKNKRQEKILTKNIKLF